MTLRVATEWRSGRLAAAGLELRSAETCLIRLYSAGGNSAPEIDDRLYRVLPDGRLRHFPCGKQRPEVAVGNHRDLRLHEKRRNRPSTEPVGALGTSSTVANSAVQGGSTNTSVAA